MYGNMRIVLIGRGLNGWHTRTVGDGCTGSGSGGDLEDYVREAGDGVPVYDASEANVNAFAHIVIAGPMVDPTLGKGEIRKFNCTDKRTLLGMLPGLGGDFHTVGVMALADIGSLDSVAVDVYLQMLREKVPGVRFGTVYNHQVVWEQELVEDTMLDPSDIPSDYPVQPLPLGSKTDGMAICGTCGLAWDDGISTSMTPTPSGRCPFETFHIHNDRQCPEGCDHKHTPGCAFSCYDDE